MLHDPTIAAGEGDAGFRFTIPHHLVGPDAMVIGIR